MNKPTAFQSALFSNQSKIGSQNMTNSALSSKNKLSSKVHRSLFRFTNLTAGLALSLATVMQPIAVTTAHAQAAPQNYIKISAENASRPKLVSLGLDKSLVVDLPADANDVLVANPKVADAVMRTSRRMYLFGKQIGQTNVFVFDGSGKQIAALEILIERDIAGLESSINRLIPNSNIKAEMINDNIVLTGTVPTPLAATKAVQLAQIFVQGGEQATNANAAGGGLAALFGDEDQSQIVNLIKIDGQDQVMLKVTVAEMVRSVTKQLGIDTTISNGSNGGFGFSVAGGGLPSQTVAGSLTSTLGITHGLNALQSQLRAMENAGVVRTLAEPNLTAVSGEEAEFRVGGTWQIPSNYDLREGFTVTFEEQQYGIYLKFLPTVLSEGRISLKLQTEVTEPSPVGSGTHTNRVNSAGTRNRRASTTVELPSGGSMAIAGLVQDDIRQAINGSPGLAKIPVLGTLFRSREFIRNETELVIIVTPYLVRPTARRNLTQPDENFQPASEGASVFMGRVNRVYGTKQGNLPKGRYTGSIGFILK